MNLKKGQGAIVIVNILAIIFFAFKAVNRENYEFIIYMGVIIFFFSLIYLTNNRINFSNKILWGLTIWAIMHMSGGLLFVNGSILYKFVFVKLVEHPEYVILKYDQVVHFFGFFVATLAGYEILAPNLKCKLGGKINLLIFLFGAGLGAMNEIVEFIAVLILPETGVGGYYNTLWDLVFNSIGSLFAIFFINITKNKLK